MTSGQPTNIPTEKDLLMLMLMFFSCLKLCSVAVIVLGSRDTLSTGSESLHCYVYYQLMCVGVANIPYNPYRWAIFQDVCQYCQLIGLEMLPIQLFDSTI